MQLSGVPEALRSDTLGRPVWLIITARAGGLPRASQNVKMAVTPLCPNGGTRALLDWRQLAGAHSE